ncbi:MAG: thiamine diphosphokinase, partial [Clostridia bacterium]|nr:thiamine diphosphokinase [Clostridia bacterium]
MKVLIIASGNHHSPGRLREYAQAADYIICADGGYDHAKAAGIVPHILVGDFDSVTEDISGFSRKVQLPREKDETDSLYALRFAFSKGANKIVLYGGLGDRYDHSYANICLLYQAMVRDIPMVLTDGITEIYLTDHHLLLEKSPGTIVSVYAFSDVCEGVTLNGLKYPLRNAVLDKYNIIGTSNEFVA